MNWIAKAWCLIVGTPEECGHLDRETHGKVTSMVKRAYVVGVITGFTLFAVLYQVF